MTPMEAPPGWERQKGERSKQCAVRQIYYQMGPDRSLVKLRRRLQDGEASVPTLRTLERWCAKYGWVAHAEAYDAHMSHIAQQALERKTHEWVSKELEDAEQQLGRWREAFAMMPFHEQDVVSETTDRATGEKIKVVVLKSNVNKMLALTRWRKAISDQGRKALGLPDRITEQHTAHSGAMTQNVITDWRSFIEKLNEANRDLQQQADAATRDNRFHRDNEESDW